MLSRNKNFLISVEGLKGTVLQPRVMNLIFPSPVGDDDGNSITLLSTKIDQSQKTQIDSIFLIINWNSSGILFRHAFHDCGDKFSTRHCLGRRNGNHSREELSLLGPSFGLRTVFSIAVVLIN